MTRAGMHRTTPSPFYKDGVNIKPNVGATDKLLLPLQNTPAAPTVAFGDGDSGLYESGDDVIKITLAGTKYFRIQSAIIGGDNYDGSAEIIDDPGGATVSVFRFRGDTDTGFGRAGADILSLIAGGVEGLRITEVSGYTKTQLQLIATANAPTYTEGAIYYDSTLHKLRIGGAAGWETVTSV